MSDIDVDEILTLIFSSISLAASILIIVSWIVFPKVCCTRVVTAKLEISGFWRERPIHDLFFPVDICNRDAARVM